MLAGVTGRACVWALLAAFFASPGLADAPPVAYEPTWESLDKHQTPRWLMDAKLGLFVYSASPTEREWNQWYEKYGDLPNVRPHGSSRYVFGHDAWNRLDWTPDDLAQLAVDMGAKYLVWSHASAGFFVNHPSRFTDVEGSAFVRMEPKDRDYTGEVAHAVRSRGLRFGVYTNYIHPIDHPQWIEIVKEVIDLYQPATLWFDGDKLSYPAEQLRSKELLAYYYNHSKSPDEVAAEDALGSHKGTTWGRELSHGDWFRKEMSPPHSEIPEGYFVRYETVYRWRNRSPVGQSDGLVNNLVEWLADAVSKNGNLELAIHLEPTLYEFEKRMLRQLGAWLEVNGEAIYDTRPWREATAEDQTASGIHVRYTTKGDSLYAILFRWPQGNMVFSRLRAKEGSRIGMLGIEPDLAWKQTDAGLEVSRPPGSGGEGFETEIPCDHAYSIRITPRPEFAGQPAKVP